MSQDVDHFFDLLHTYHRTMNLSMCCFPPPPLPPPPPVSSKLARSSSSSSSSSSSQSNPFMPKDLDNGRSFSAKDLENARAYSKELEASRAYFKKEIDTSRSFGLSLKDADAHHRSSRTYSLKDIVRRFSVSPALVFQAIRCTQQTCSCECFAPGKACLRYCDTCNHGWVAHGEFKFHICIVPIRLDVVNSVDFYKQ